MTRALATDEIIEKLRSGEAKVRIQGPYGYPVADMAACDSVISIGTGSGIVPMLSLLEQRCMLMSLLGKEALGNTKSSHVVPPTPEAAQNVTDDAGAPGHDDDTRHHGLAYLQLKYRVRKLRLDGSSSTYFRSRIKAASVQKLHLVAEIIGWFLVAMETTAIGLFLSFSNLGQIAVRPWQATTLMVLSIVLVSSYTLHLLYRLKSPLRFVRSLWTALDMLISLIACVVVGWWSGHRMFASPSPLQQILYSLLAIYRIARLMQSNPVLRPHSHRMGVTSKTNVLGAEKFELIWVCNSADLAGACVPLVNQKIETMHNNIYGTPALAGKWDAGLGKFVDLHFYVTDKDPARCEALRKLVQDTPMHGKVTFARPVLSELILKVKVKELIEYVSGAAGAATSFNVAVTFCGSPVVGEVCHRAVCTSNALSALIGHSQFFASFRSEDY